jgi:DNA-binding MarR family transcriptional regulator
MTGDDDGVVAPDTDVLAHEDVVDAVIRASRVLVGVAVRSIAATNDDVTVPQYRTLVLLVGMGPQRIADIAGLLGVEPSTATRMAERLVRKGLAERTADESDRRVVWLAATDAARDLVASVTSRRREEVRQILQRMPTERLEPLVSALREFTEASGDPLEQSPTLGWAP